MEDEETGSSTAARVMAVATAAVEEDDWEEQPTTAGEKSVKKCVMPPNDDLPGEVKDDDDDDDIYTAVAFPGCDLFSSWLGRAEEDPVKDASLDAFMGKYYNKVEEDETEGGGVAAAASVTISKHESIHSNYELYDTPVWRARKRELLAKKLETLKEQPVRCSRIATGEVNLEVTAHHALEKIRRYGSRVLVIMIGIGMALIGYAIVSAADALHDVKINYAQTFFPNYLKGFGAHVGLSLLYVTVAYLPVAYRPIVAGSGIDYAKAMLNGINVPECAGLVTMLCKGVGIVFTSAASLPVGLEGPMIHSGLCLGANAWRIIPRNVPSFDTLFSDRSRRDFAAIGTSAGVAGE